MKNYRVFLLSLGTILLLWSVWVGFTWQLVPVSLCLFLILVAVIRFKKEKRRVFFTLLVLILPALSIFLLYAFPFVELPTPGGPYAVGVTYRQVDTRRDETFTNDPGDKRSIYLKIWYPARAAAHPNPYLEDGEQVVSLLLGRMGIPSFLFQQLRKTETNGFTNAAIAEGRFPLITFSHGYGSWFGQNTALMEELASQGYIVASIAHSHQTAFAATNDSTLVTFPRLVPLYDPKAKPPADTAHQKLAQKIFAEKADVDKQQMEEFVNKVIEASSLANSYSQIWADDITSTIDFMLQENETGASTFYGRIDAGKIGAAGMSFGGSASAEAALQDRRIQAAINMDGMPYGSWLNDTISTPVLFLEESKSPRNYSIYSPLFKRSKSSVHCLLFKKAHHYNFTDVNLLSPAFRWIGLLGEVDGDFMINSMNAIIPDYFNATFSNKSFQVKKYIHSGAIEEAAY